MLCNDLNPKRAEFLDDKLREALDEATGPLANLKSKVTVKVFNQTFHDFVDTITDKYSKALRVAAVFGFIDPFGYSTASINSVMKLYTVSRRCDLLINLMSGYLNRFRNVDAVAGAIHAAIGDTDLPPGQSEVAKAYELALKKRGVKYTTRFGVCSNSTGGGGFTYHLVFAAHHRRGLELIKDCMWSATVAQPHKKGAKVFQELFYCQGKAEIDALVGGKDGKLNLAYPEVRELLLNKYGGKTNVRVQLVKDFLLEETCLPVK